MPRTQARRRAASREAVGEPRDDAVDRQLRIGADRRREQRPVEHVQVARGGDGGRSTSTTARRGSAPNGAAAHHVRATPRGVTSGAQRRSASIAALARRRSVVNARAVAVDRHHARRAGGELDLGHRAERAAHAVPHVRRERIVEHRRAVVAQRARCRRGCPDGSRRAAARSAPAGCGSSRIHRACASPSSGSVIAVEHRMQRRRLELVADRAVDAAACRGSDRSRSICGAPAKPSTRSGISAADTTVGCRNVRLPTSRADRAAPLRSSSAGVPIAPAAATNARARTRDPARGRVRCRARPSPRTSSAATRSPREREAAARARA